MVSRRRALHGPLIEKETAIDCAVGALDRRRPVPEHATRNTEDYSWDREAPDQQVETDMDGRMCGLSFLDDEVEKKCGRVV